MIARDDRRTDEHALVFLGCGRKTRAQSAALAELVPELPRFYASSDPEKARAFNRRFGGAGWYGSWPAALDDVRSTIALIATPLATRFGLTFAALAADRHVFVEMPAFRSASDCELVRDAASAAGRCVMVAANGHYRPLAGHLRRIITGRSLGDVRLLRVNALHERASESRRTDPGADGSAAFFENGIHWISLMADLGMDIERVTGHAAGPAGSGRTWVVTVEYANGAIGQLSWSSEIAAPPRGFRLSALYGTAGTALFETNGLFVLETGRRRRLVLPALDDPHGHRAMFSDFLQALRVGRQPRYTLAHARRDVALLEEICQSNAPGFRWETAAREDAAPRTG